MSTHDKQPNTFYCSETFAAYFVWASVRIRDLSWLIIPLLEYSTYISVDQTTCCPNTWCPLWDLAEYYEVSLTAMIRDAVLTVCRWHFCWSGRQKGQRLTAFTERTRVYFPPPSVFVVRTYSIIGYWVIRVLLPSRKDHTSEAVSLTAWSGPTRGTAETSQMQTC